MTYTWYKLFSLPEFEATGLVSRNLLLTLEGRGQEEFLITKANTVGVTYDGVFLPVTFLDRNPYAVQGYAVYKDADQNVWFGFEVIV